MGEKEEATANYIRVSSKQLSGAIVAIITTLGSIAMVIGNGDIDSSDASKIQIDTNESSIAKLADRIWTVESSTSSLKYIQVDIIKSQKVLEDKMDMCQTNMASMDQHVQSNDFLIKQCMRVTGQ